MAIKVHTIGGFSGVGANSVAIEIDQDIFIIDLGLNMDNYVRLTQEINEEITPLTLNMLQEANAIPDIEHLKKIRNKVKAILISHAHLDHVGAVPFLIDLFPNVPVYGTPFTIKLLEKLFEDRNKIVRNPLIVVNPNSKVPLRNDVVAEFIYMTHSTPQTCIVVLHTKEGQIVYANDFKLDNAPVLGGKPNLKRLSELDNVKLLIMDSLYADTPGKTPSEKIAREMLKDVLLSLDSSNNLIVTTTFASHIARLKTLVELGEKLERKILMLGRSLVKYTSAAEEVGIISFKGRAKIKGYRKQIEKILNKVERKPEKYFLIVTGHQGEPNSVLSRMVNGSYFFNKNDIVIFSSKVIPTETNIENREIIELKLKKLGVRLFKDLHVSGHSYREDLREIINTVRPELILPSHASLEKRLQLQELAMEEGYGSEQVIIANDSEHYDLDKFF